jgi:hypothetical protein
MSHRTDWSEERCICLHFCKWVLGVRGFAVGVRLSSNKTSISLYMIVVLEDKIYAGGI